MLGKQAVKTIQTVSLHYYFQAEEGEGTFQVKIGTERDTVQFLGRLTLTVSTKGRINVYILRIYSSFILLDTQKKVM